jgi:tRNA threonylcarbamoyladenosine biosynthesis protein TsaB
MQPHFPSTDRPALLLALSVHWDDCSVALGTRDTLATEVWSQQPERAIPTGAGSHLGPLASRDALLLVDRLLVRTDTPLSAVERLCFAQGPGAFTSLRVAAGLVQGLSLAISKPVAGICSLAAMVAHEPGWRQMKGGSDEAAGVPAVAVPGRARSWLQLSAIDARMGECYFGLHQCRSGHYPEPLMAPAVGKPADAVAVFAQVLAQHQAHDAALAIVLAGNAFMLLPDLAAWARKAGFDPGEAARRIPTAAAVLAVAASEGAPAGGPPAQALPVYVRDKIALDVTEQRVQAAARALAAAQGRLQ